MWGTWPPAGATPVNQRPRTRTAAATTLHFVGESAQGTARSSDRSPAMRRASSEVRVLGKHDRRTASGSLPSDRKVGFCNCLTSDWATPSRLRCGGSCLSVQYTFCTAHARWPSQTIRCTISAGSPLHLKSNNRAFWRRLPSLPSSAGDHTALHGYVAEMKSVNRSRCETGQLRTTSGERATSSEAPSRQDCPGDAGVAAAAASALHGRGPTPPPRNALRRGAHPGPGTGAARRRGWCRATKAAVATARRRTASCTPCLPPGSPPGGPVALSTRGAGMHAPSAPSAAAPGP
mmetsp:Transcript_557/g.1071  ORF Transcript_557/g.1071 Transcript_557/m.1071 type:complete len:291 (-) Transcript_557:18-890(-)